VLTAERVPANCPALVLNADHRPLSYFPLSLWSWQDAIKAVFLERVNILAEYERPARNPAFTRFNVFLRDCFECQYCGAPEDLTFDHVVPRSRGGRTTWDNVVTACAPCNLLKGGRLANQAGMHPRQRPHRPTINELRNNGRLFPPNYLHDSWADYLYWDSVLEP
jgi:5-methylcytosine-specific restriction endonuclease McrA